jgi:hypothetical protein
MPLAPDRDQWIAWGMTLILESAAAAALWPLLHLRHAPRAGAVLAVVTVFAVNALTHPIFWLALCRLPHPGPPAVLLAEIAVIVVEAALYSRLLALSPPRALGLSLALNLLSWLGGTTLWQRLLLWHLI